ncbi:MAG: SdpI family protein [Thermoanaerobaculaceae bacterium]|nr:SdpI family protein [Thermoanaerobaculaceae bacterium]
MIVPIPWVHAGIGLLIALISIPLVLRMVPMNHLYGIRVRRAFASRDNWYAINAYGGKVLFWVGVFLLVVAYAGRDVAPPPTSPWAPVYLVVPLLALVPAIALINAFARRLPDRSPR